MKNGAKIFRISGPVVVAQGLDARMYDLVRVGNERLMGEVIQVNRDKTVIQVYEETTGLKPGEPVENTHAPLSIELGPGLLSQIYDGIQRPLPALKEIMGDFISRGVSAPGLDQQKKWEFKASTKKGDEVSGGDVIGTVQETKFLEHKILVPPTISGKIKEISSGKFTVTEPIVTLEGGEKLFLSHKWPVRKPRPARQKLLPQVPLVTGQRILDTLFPIAKGGTGAIPGPFGSGKCVSGNTLIFADEKLLPIKDLFEDSLNKKIGKINQNHDETIIELEKAILVQTFNGEKIVEAHATHLYRGKTDRLIEIKTRTGRKAKLTPAHKLFRLNDELAIEEVPAGMLKKGDFIVSPRKMVTENKYHKITLDPSFRISGNDLRQEIKDVIDVYCEKNKISKKELAQKLYVKYDTLMNFYLKRTCPTIAFIEKLAKETEHYFEIQAIKVERDSKPITVPAYFSEEFAEFLGYIMSDGMIKGKRTVHFFNKKKELRERVKILAKKLFNLESKDYYARTVEAVDISSTALARMLNSLGVPFAKKSNYVSVPFSLLNSPENAIKEFLKAYIACDGHISENDIEITTASIRMQEGISYLLLRLGVMFKASEKNVKGKTYYRIFISPTEANKIGDYFNKKNYFTGIDIVPMTPELFKKILSETKPFKLEKHGIATAGYYVKQNQTAANFKKTISFLKNQNFEKLACALDWIYFDKITEVNKLESNEFVYDLTVPSTHNFVGGNLPMLLHNTVTQQQLAKWSDAEIVVYIGCGERGNEMTEVLTEFPQLQDVKTGAPLMERTVLIANTSNMPVAAREASVYTGMTIAEYFRDQGYNVSLMADSTSRWAEAMREISSRLEEMPGEEGYPAYLAARLAEFYERAGRAVCLGHDKERIGSVTAIGAVSPPGGDFSEPVTQNTLKITKVFWALDAKLAQRRHFPAINWLDSYSLYTKSLEDWYSENVSADFGKTRATVMKILQQEASLQEIVQLVGSDALPEKEQLTLETARLIREGFLQQNAYHEIDSYCSLKKQYAILRLIVRFSELAYEALENGASVGAIAGLESKSRITKSCLIAEDSFFEEIKKIEKEMEKEFSGI